MDPRRDCVRGFLSQDGLHVESHQKCASNALGVCHSFQGTLRNLHLAEQTTSAKPPQHLSKERLHTLNH